MNVSLIVLALYIVTTLILTVYQGMKNESPRNDYVRKKSEIPGRLRMWGVGVAATVTLFITVSNWDQIVIHVGRAIDLLPASMQPVGIAVVSLAGPFSGLCMVLYSFNCLISFSEYSFFEGYERY